MGSSIHMAVLLYSACLVHSNEIKCNGTDTYLMTIGQPNYCGYYYIFHGGTCDSFTSARGKLVVDDHEPVDANASGRFHRQCSPQRSGASVAIVCLCKTNYCNTLPELKSILTEVSELKKVPVSGFISVPEESDAINLFACMKRNLSLNAVRRGNQVVILPEQKNKLMLYILVGSAGGCLILVALIVILMPIIMKYKRERHKKWLERTWDERVRKAGEELDRQSSEEANTRAKRKRAAEKASQEAWSNDGSKDIGSRDPSRDMGSRDADDPFGNYVSKMGHIDIPAAPPDGNFGQNQMWGGNQNQMGGGPFGGAGYPARPGAADPMGYGRGPPGGGGGPMGGGAAARNFGAFGYGGR